MALYNEEISLEHINHDASVDPLKEITFGALSGMLGKVVEYPFDTIKVRLQSSSIEGSTWNCITKTYRDEGIIGGFYKGLRAPLIGACFETAVLFTAYNYTTQIFSKQMNQSENDLPLWTKCVSGGNAGLAASFVLTPVELVKCRLQVLNIVAEELGLVISTRNMYGKVIKDILRNEGVFGLWLGLSSTLIREVFGTAVWFGTYEFACAHFKGKGKEELDDLELMLSGATAGVMFNLTTFPVDTIKSNIQTQSDAQGSSMLHMAIKVYRKNNLGLRNFYNGLGITIIRAIPANAIIFYAYETLKRNF